MVRSMIGFAGFAIVVLIGLRLLGFAVGLLGVLFKLALLGVCFYLVLRIFFPSAADRVKETIKGRPAATD